MRNGWRPNPRRFPCLLAAFGLLVALAPGCGEAPLPKDESAGGIPKALSQSNDQMLKFMQSKSAAAKKK